MIFLTGSLLVACTENKPDDPPIPSPTKPVAVVNRITPTETATHKPKKKRKTTLITSETSLISPSATLIPTETVVPWLGYPAPTTTPATEIPPPVPLFTLSPNIITAVLLGTDVDAPRLGRTDTIILVLVNKENGAASLISIPRDLFLYLPGWNMERLNTAFAFGGFELLASTLEYNLGIRPEFWVLVHMNDFVQFINDLGGIDVPVSDAMPDDCGGIPPGVFHMNGEVALCYVRERRTTSEFARSRRQQEVLKVIFKRALNLDILLHLPEWYERNATSLQTNLSLEDLLSFVPVALKLPSGGLHMFQIAWNEVTSWKIPETGARVVLPRRENIIPIIQQSIDILLPASPTIQASPTLNSTYLVTLTITPSPDITSTPTGTTTPSP